MSLVFSGIIITIGTIMLGLFLSAAIVIGVITIIGLVVESIAYHKLKNRLSKMNKEKTNDDQN